MKEFDVSGCVNQSLREWGEQWVQGGKDDIGFKSRFIKRFKYVGGINDYGVIGLRDVALIVHILNDEGVDRAMHVLPVYVGGSEFDMLVCVLDGTPSKGWGMMVKTSAGEGEMKCIVRIGWRDTMFGFVLGEFKVGDDVLGAVAGKYIPKVNAHMYMSVKQRGLGVVEYG